MYTEQRVVKATARQDKKNSAKLTNMRGQTLYSVIKKLVIKLVINQKLAQ